MSKKRTVIENYTNLQNTRDKYLAEGGHLFSDKKQFIRYHQKDHALKKTNQRGEKRFLDNFEHEYDSSEVAYKYFLR